jgi:hypothetical protein
MLTLNSNLQTAQDGSIHNPIIDLLSQKPIEDIPFAGNIFNSSTKEMKPKFFVHSSGAIIGLNLRYYSSTVNHLYFFNTDANRIEFDINNAIITNADVDDFDLVEMPDGNIAVIYISGNAIKSLILNTSGAILSGPTTIDSTTSNTKRSISLILLSNGTYLTVYSKFVSPSWQVIQRTSADFITWDSGTDIVGSFGLASVADYFWCDGLDLIETVDGSELLLFFNYADSIDTNNNPLYNIQYSISTDNGGTWGNSIKITSYDDFTRIGYYPSSVLIGSSLYVAHTQEAGALFIGRDTTGWPTVVTGDISIYPANLMIDTANQKLYAAISNHGPVHFNLQGLIEIDINTWSITRTRDFTSTPVIPAVFNGLSSDQRNFITSMSGNQVIFGGSAHLGVWDTQADTIRGFHFSDDSGTETVANIEGYPENRSKPNKFQYDEANNYVWCIGSGNHGGISYSMVVGYIDLAETGPTYTFNTFLNVVLGSDIFGYYVRTIYLTNDKTECWMMADNAYGYGHGIRAFLLDGSNAEFYSLGSDPDGGMPKEVIKDLVKYGNFVYFVFPYYGSEGYDHQKGLGILDTTTDNVRYLQPSYKTANDYGFISMTLNESLEEIYIGTSSDGVVIYNINTESFTRKSNDEIPGITPNGGDNLSDVIYDEANDRFFAISWGMSGITTFLREGKLKRTYYQIGTKTTGWDFTEESVLTTGALSHNTTLGVDEDGVLWSFFQNDYNAFADHNLLWDKLEPSYNLTEYLTGEVVWRKSISGKPNELEASFSNGHLFDPSNNLSLLSGYLKKGRKLVLKAGEKVSDVDYWQNQGTFYIVETSAKYSSREYPVIKIRAEDFRTFWGIDELMVVSEMGVTPETLLSNLAENYGDVDEANINIPTMVGSFLLDAQWAEVYLNDIIEEITSRFGYYPRVTTNNIFTVKQISEDASVDHSYSDKLAVIEYSPDDSYSDFTNRIIVTGEEQDDTEITFAEERLASLNGTFGWWGGKKKFTIYYSEDKSRRARYPRLEIIDSTQSMMFSLFGKVTEEISYVDTEEQYCIVKVESDSLIAVLAGAIATIAVGMYVGDTVTGTWTKPVGTLICNIGIITALNVLGSVVTFQYEVHGLPVGYIRRSVEYTSDDLEFQQELGKIITNKEEGFACYTVAHCKVYADFLISIARMQRKRVKFSKVAHLQDEDGDVISIPHHYSNTTINIFITDLVRKYKQGDDGYFMDEIEGWRI